MAGEKRPQIRLRRATLADAPLLGRWEKKPHVIAATGAEADDVWDWDGEIAKNPPWRDILIGEADGRPVGIVVIIDPKVEETHYWGDVESGFRAIDIWIGEEADLGQGYGSAMMRLALGWCFAEPAVSAVLVDPLAANTRAHRFYEGLGFRRVARRMFGADDCYVYQLDRLARSAET